ncbi:S53 family peptidase [Actinoplanes sp. NPDC049596]|uniref:S53 family peptidase n=1 Tax=unclassified Actinoplanes TaxID=2626549 RepID=UPI003430DA92
MINSPTARSRLAFVAALGAAAASVLGAGPAVAADKPGRHALAGSQPRWLSRAKATGGAPASADTIGFGLLLKLRDSAAAEARVAAVSDPASPSYGKYLSSADFKSTFAPSASDVSAVQSWLRGQGFTLRDTLGGMYVEASGTTAHINKVFGTTVKNYTYHGQTVRANSTALSLPENTPSSVIGVVSGVLGIDQGQALKKPADTLPGPMDGFRAATPCSSYYGQKTAANGKPYVVCGYEPKQYQSAYGESDLLKRGIDGRGVTVAVTDAFASPTIVSDVATYNRKHGLPAFQRGQFRQITPAPDGYDKIDECAGNGWYGEETLDIEAVHSMAPGANIVYVGAADCDASLDEAWAETIDNHVADIVTNSWGSPEPDEANSGVAFYQQFSLEAALTGITVDFSSGDAGDETQGSTHPELKTVEFPTDLPYVTSVGGTSVGIDKAGKRAWEYGWQTAYTPITADGTPEGDAAYSSGGGGGTSALFEQPYYQRGIVPASISKYFGTATPMRAVPDISMAADSNTGFLVGQTQVFPDGKYYDEYRAGGTSLASPLLAGMQAVASQKAHHPIGFANPAYYRAAGTAAIDDIVAPKKPVRQVRVNYVNSVDPSEGRTYLLETVDVQTTTIHSTEGYDAETGVGTPGPRFFGR